MDTQKAAAEEKAAKAKAEYEAGYQAAREGVWNVRKDNAKAPLGFIGNKLMEKHAEIYGSETDPNKSADGNSGFHDGQKEAWGH